MTEEIRNPNSQNGVPPDGAEPESNERHGGDANATTGFFPDSAPPRLVEAVKEYLARREQGIRVNRRELLERYADVSAELEKCLGGLEFIEGAAPRFSEGDSMPSGVRTLEGEAAGQPLGDFQIIREVARGGMGIVYEAEQLSLRRRVALKVLPFAAALDSRALQRFRQESLAAAQLDHPHIVHVYGVGSDRGVHFYAMQFIEGQSLAQVIAGMKAPDARSSREAPPSAAVNRVDAVEVVDNVEESKGSRASQRQIDLASGRRKPADDLNEVDSLGAAGTLALRGAGLSTDRVGNRREYYRGIARLGIQAAEALDYAHSNGVLHRDVKPGNLLVDGMGDVWITDFGLARVECAGSLTFTGDLMGTLRYMSPEQLLAERGLVDQRTDVYSLGATLYEVLTLVPVFSAENRVELLNQIAKNDPATPRRLDRGIPEELETIVLKCLEKEPADRYATAQHLADDLRRFLEHQPIAARQPWLAERLRKWTRRHQTLVFAASVALFLSTAILAGSTIWVMSERDAAREAERNEAAQVLVSRAATADAQQARERAEESRKAAEESRNLEERQRLLAEAANNESLAAAARARSEQQTAQQTAEFVINLFRSGDAMGLQGTGFRTPRETIHGVTIADLLSRAADRVRIELQSQPETQATLLDTLGDIYRNLGMFSRAEPLLADALELRRRHLPEEDARIGESLHHLGWLKYDAGDHIGAESLYRAALEHFENWPPADLRARLRVQMSFAWLVCDQKADDAERIFRKVLAACHGKEKEYAVELTAAQAGLVSALYAQGRHDDAQLATLKQLADRNQLLVAKGIALAKEAEERSRAKDFNTALEIQHQLIEMVREQLGTEHPSYALLLGEAAGFNRRKGDWREAEKLMRESMEYGRRSLGDHPKVWEAVISFATDLGNRGDFDEGEELLQDVRRIVARRYAPLDPRTPGHVRAVLEKLGALHVNGGKYAQAAVEFEEVIRLNAPDVPSPAQQIAERNGKAAVQMRLVQILHFVGRLAESRQMLHDALDSVPAAEGYLRLVAVERDVGEYANAREAAMQSLAIARDNQIISGFGLGVGNPDWSDDLRVFHETAQSELRWREILDRAKRETLGDSPMDVGNVAASLGDLLSFRGRFAEAEPFYRQALAIRRGCVAEDDTHCTNEMLRLARALIGKGEHAEGLRLAREAVALRDKRYGREHLWFPVALKELAADLDSAGEVAEARTIMMKALELRMRKLPLVHPFVSKDHAILAALHQKLGEHQAAGELLRGYLEPLRKLLPDRSWRIAELESLLAESLIELGDLSGAEKLLLHALPIHDADRTFRPDAPHTTRKQLVRLHETWQKPAEASRFRE
jgi:serine/threonine protein kinase